MAKKNKAKKEKNLMDMVPERIQKWETQENGLIHVLYPRFQWGPLRKWLLPRLRNPFFRIKLDELGSKVWERIDGELTVFQIGRKVCEAVAEQESEIWYQRMAVYVQTLHNGRLIVLKDKTPNSPEGNPSDE